MGRDKTAEIPRARAGWRTRPTAATLPRVQPGAQHHDRMIEATEPESSDVGVSASLRLRRDRAERILNGLRAGILCLLIAAALAYAPSLPTELNLTNVLVLTPPLLWTIAQYLVWYRRPLLPDWLSVANAVIDVTAVTAIIGGYAIAESGVLAVRSPIFRCRFRRNGN